MADPEFELQGGGGGEGEEGGGVLLLALVVFLPSVISSFSNQNKGGGASPRSAVENQKLCKSLSHRLSSFSRITFVRTAV